MPYESCQNLQQLVGALLVRKELPAFPPLPAPVHGVCRGLLTFDVRGRAERPTTNHQNATATP